MKKELTASEAFNLMADSYEELIDVMNLNTAFFSNQMKLLATMMFCQTIVIIVTILILI